MARRGRQEFSVQEAVNMDSFGDFNYEVIDLDGDPAGAQTVTAITASNPAKKVVIYNKPGSATATLADADVLTLTINGKTLDIDSTDLPFTFSGFLITSMTITNVTADSTDAVSVISFH